MDLNTQANLPSLSLSHRALFTGYLLVISLGLAVAGAQILLTHGMADGKFGLSLDDVVYSYYGNRGDSRLEAKLNGSMKDKASTQARTEIIRWVRDGSPEDRWDAGISARFSENCVKCHGGIPGLPKFTSYAEAKQFAKIDTGASVHSLTRVSHIHLFGIAFIYFFVGLIFSLAVRVPPRLKAVAIAFPFVFLVVDVGTWWLTKWYPGFAYLTILVGFGYATSSVFMIGTSLYQMWIMPKRSPAQPPTPDSHEPDV